MVQMTKTPSGDPVVLRVKFFKKGNLQYISHLDLVRTMMKVIVRAGLPLRYTEGFNPKPKLTFAAPLSIGTESMCEYMDIRLTERMEPELVIKNLNANMAPDMQALEAYYPDGKLSELAWLAYRITIDALGDISSNKEKIRAVLTADSIFVEKRGKEGETFDIKPLIRSVDVGELDGKIVVDAVISADQSKFLNPEYLIQAIKIGAGVLAFEDIVKEGYSIVRLEAYDGDMNIFR